MGLDWRLAELRRGSGFIWQLEKLHSLRECLGVQHPNLGYSEVARHAEHGGVIVFENNDFGTLNFGLLSPKSTANKMVIVERNGFEREFEWGGLAIHPRYLLAAHDNPENFPSYSNAVLRRINSCYGEKIEEYKASIADRLKPSYILEIIDKEGLTEATLLKIAQEGRHLEPEDITDILKRVNIIHITDERGSLFLLSPESDENTARLITWQEYQPTVREKPWEQITLTEFDNPGIYSARRTYTNYPPGAIQTIKVTNHDRVVTTLIKMTNEATGPFKNFLRDMVAEMGVNLQ